jgi:hypothetical protein
MKINMPVADAAESLEEQAQSLVITVGTFKVDNSENTVFQPQEMKATHKETTLTRASFN